MKKIVIMLSLFMSVLSAIMHAKDVAAEDVRIKKGDYEYVFSTGKDVDIKLRLFGVNTIQQVYGNANIEQYAVLSHFFIASPAEASSRIFNESLCEEKAVKQASILQVIVKDAQVDADVNRLPNDDRLCAQIQGVAMVLKEYRFKNGPPQRKWQINGGGEFNFNVKKFLLLTGIEAVSCE